LPISEDTTDIEAATQNTSTINTEIEIFPFHPVCPAEPVCTGKPPFFVAEVKTELTVLGSHKVSTELYPFGVELPMIVDDAHIFMSITASHIIDPCSTILSYIIEAR
jgi:hypothetical protein